MPGRQLVPYQDDNRFMSIPDVAIAPIPVANIAYGQAELAAGVEGIQATDSTAPATAIFDMDLGFEQASLSAGLGALINDIALVYSVGAQALTGQPTVTINGVTYGIAGATGAAPVVAAVGGTITTVPATLPTAVSTAGQAYTGTLSLGTPYRLNTDLQKVTARISVPMAVGGTFLLLGAFVHFTARGAQ